MLYNDDAPEQDDDEVSDEDEDLGESSSESDRRADDERLMTTKLVFVYDDGSQRARLAHGPSAGGALRLTPLCAVARPPPLRRARLLPSPPLSPRQAAC